MASGIPLTARTLARSHQSDLQRIANPHLEANERRLRPIYDFMEIHNYRKALTESDRLLKKHPNFTACKALKCLVLLKLERHDDACALASELDALVLATANVAPAGDSLNPDENTLTFLSQYYKDLRQFDKVVGIYEAAIKREPTNEEYLCSLFMAYVRTKDYKNQSLIAQKLYKHTRKTPYYSWAVISVLLQIDESSNQLKQTLYIPMALKMLEKEFFDESIQQKKSYGEIECLLYLHGLELKEEFSKALLFLEKHLDELTKSSSNESMLPAYFSHDKLLTLNYKAKNFDTAYRLAKQFLKEDNYIWNWYEVLFDTFFQFDNEKQNQLINDLHEFIQSTPDSLTDLRDVHLARIELGYRWQMVKLKENSIVLPQLASTYLSDIFFNQITFYIETYSLKTTGLVMYDIYRLLEYLSNDERLRLHQYLIEQINSEKTRNNAQYLINIIYCARLCGDIHTSWLKENSSSLIQRLLDTANQSTSLSVDLLLLIVNTMDEINRTKSDLYSLLDRIYEKDTSNFDTKLYIYKLALYFNSLTTMKDYFELLEIKNIQYYSLGYLLTDHYLRIHTNYRHIKNFFNYLTNLLYVYTEDSWNQIIFCYKYGNFLRINEIRTFADNYLSYALTYIQSLVGSIVIDLVQNGIRYNSIRNLFQSSKSQILFQHKEYKNYSLHSVFYKTDTTEILRIQDTRDLDIWPKIDHRRLRFDPINNNRKPTENPSYADRALCDSSGSTTYNAPSYKDSYLRQHQTNDFQQRVTLCYFRSTILNFLNTIYMDRLTNKNEASAQTVIMPDEQTFNGLKIIINNFDECTKLFDKNETIFPCELQTIIELELYKSIPLFVAILIDGLTLNNNANATSTEIKVSLTSTTVNFDKIDLNMNKIYQQIEQSYKILVEKLEKTSFLKRCQPETKNTLNIKNNDFLNDFSGQQCALEYYSIYTEFISYIYSFYIAIKSILATLFNKTSLLTDNSDNTTNRPATTKKSKKKSSEQQQTTTNETSENENETRLWNQFDKFEFLLNEQWSRISENIEKYELYLRSQVKLTDQDYNRIERELIGNSEQQLNKTKSKSDENNNNDKLSTTKEAESDNINNASTSIFDLQLDESPMRPSTIRTFAMSYLESLMQIRVCLKDKQKTLRIRQP